MKSRFNTIDIRATLSELRSRFLGMRVANVYDIDSKTYLIKLAKPDLKAMILMESGIRIQSTEFEWPKNMNPSGFSMKLRKHLRTRRLEKVEQLGVDRIVDLQFGSGEAAYHVILELYDRGNIVLTDFEYSIMNILRQRTDESQDVRFAVRETYPVSNARQHEGAIDEETLVSYLLSAKEGDNLKKILNPHLVYGPAVIEHSLLVAGILANARLGKEFSLTQDLEKLKAAIQEAEQLMSYTLSGCCKGYIIQKKEKKATVKEGESAELLTYHEFHPVLYKQHETQPYIEFDSFDKAVDEFFSKIESQKLDVKALQQEKAALKKLENVKKDHEKRIQTLQQKQDIDRIKASLIEANLHLVDSGIRIIQSALANQIDWTEIQQIVFEAQAQGDPVASAIRTLKLDSNHITMMLRDPCFAEDSSDEEAASRPMKIDIDLSLSAYSNARKYYELKKSAAKKEMKTVESSSKALKSAEKKTKQALKDVAVAASINKARKTYWFEKFLWFISSENYLVIGGRDQQQNELVVKRYLSPGDLYVHADLHGASSVIIKNPTGGTVPPKTLNEAGTMAVCHSAAWDAKVVTSAWYVHHHQVSKTAPTGEYLGTGSFMIRGKKNFLPPCYLVYGFGFIFKLDEDSLLRHKDERRVRSLDDDDGLAEEVKNSEPNQDEEIAIDADSSDEDEGSEDDNDKLENIMEEDEACEEEEKSQSGGDDAKKEKEDHQNDVQEDEEVMFPDTSIQLQHVKGDKYRLQSALSQTSEPEDKVYLGDDTPVPLHPRSPNQVKKSGGKLSAKQRREMKKKAKLQKQDDPLHCSGLGETPSVEAAKQPDAGETPSVEAAKQPDAGETPSVEAAKQPDAGETSGVEETKQYTEETPGREVKEAAVKCHQDEAKQRLTAPQQVPPKRGQKAKLKKMNKKYKDQDEEERRLRMEILQSAGPPKEVKKKGKKGKQQQKQQQQQQQQQQKPLQNKGSYPHPGRPLTVEDIKVETLAIDDKDLEQVTKTDSSLKDADHESDEEKVAILEDENLPGSEDIGLLDSLTGIPLPEDTILFSIPVCAPYSVLTNYKYKVKLTPGYNKRGKAAKTALNMFLHDRSCTPREKDLLRVVKDTDLSRHMPGKVKVSAPHLHAHKNKKK